MSFILNALRKSEQERQARQPESVTGRILLHQPQQSRSKTTKLLAFLVIANVLIIACVVWFVRNTSPPAPDTSAQVILKPQSTEETRVNSNANAISIHAEKPEQKADFKTTSIAKWVEEQKPEPAQLKVKPIITKKPPPDIIKQPAIANKPELPAQFTQPVAPFVKAEPVLTERTLVKKEVSARSDIPYLSDLSFEFRRTVPKFNINVFVYSQNPEERFVMIDMIKYKSGQQIKDAMVLKEIRPHSLVVDYQNQTFQIKRP